MNPRHVLGAGILLGLFAVAGTGLVALTFEATHEQIAENERQAMLRKLYALVPPEQFDNDLLEEARELPPSELLGSTEPRPAYVARREGEPVAVVLNPVAPDGYNGAIELLVGIYVDGSVAGVSVTKHHETPGLGDAIDESKSDWLQGFDGHSLGQPPRERWAVKKDGGAFDQLTGATITPRAVIKAVKNALLYFEAHREELLARTGPNSGGGSGG
jgi:electron transport complex protein RnfG